MERGIYGLGGFLRVSKEHLGLDFRVEGVQGLGLRVFRVWGLNAV